MKVFYCTNHDRHSPTGGGASVMVAQDEQQARELLDAELLKDDLSTSRVHPYKITELDTKVPAAKILCNGDY